MSTISWKIIICNHTNNWGSDGWHTLEYTDESDTASEKDFLEHLSNGVWDCVWLKNSQWGNKLMKQPHWNVLSHLLFLREIRTYKIGQPDIKVSSI